MYIVVNPNGKYYTNDARRFAGEQPFLWSSHKQLAKQYTKRGWARKVAERVGGNEQLLSITGGSAIRSSRGQ